MTKHVIIDWANLCHTKEEWKHNQWETKKDFNVIREIVDKITQIVNKLNDNITDDIKIYIIFPYSGKTLPPFANNYGNVLLPEDIMQNIEIFWPGGFQITEKSNQPKIKKFKGK